MPNRGALRSITNFDQKTLAESQMPFCRVRQNQKRSKVRINSIARNHKRQWEAFCSINSFYKNRSRRIKSLCQCGALRSTNNAIGELCAAIKCPGLRYSEMWMPYAKLHVLDSFIIYERGPIFVNLQHFTEINDLQYYHLHACSRFTCIYNHYYRRH